jgi:two-component system NtrC family sensor kinase
MADSPHLLDTDAIHRDKLALLGQLTAGVAHELNNPVGYVASNLNTLGKYVERVRTLIDELSAAASAAGVDATTILERHRWGRIAEDLPALVDETRQGSDHLKNLVADLKTLGRTSASREHCDPNECVLSALNVLNHLLKHGFTVHRRLAALPAIPLIRPQIIQAVTNILHNAIQAMEGHGEILVESRCADGEVCIAIENDGPPIPEEIASLIFTPYFSTKSANAGTGIGLAIVRRILEQHGGSVILAGGQHFRGPRFELRLPVDHD